MPQPPVATASETPSDNPARTRAPVGFDLETKPADQLFLSPRGEFVKIAGYTDGDDTAFTTDQDVTIKCLEDAQWIYGHGIFTFDLLALAYHHGADWDKLSAKAVDTEILDRLDYPPRARETGGSEDKYNLDSVCERRGAPGKTASLAEIAKKHGGYDAIPADDPEYLAYLRGDVDAIRALIGVLPSSPIRKGEGSAYARREHRVASLNGRMTLNGMRVNLPLLEERISKGEERKREALMALRDDFDLPLGRFEWSGRGKDKIETWTDFDNPLATLEGRKWLIEVWEAFGVRNPPVTETGRLATSAEVLRPIAESGIAHPDLRQILDLMMIVTTTRTVYQTTADHLASDGGDRVHPLIVMRQASGRSSVTSPGLTVFGKRGGRHHERDIFIPEEGHVFLSADLSQVDMRGVAALCQDPNYMKLFEPGKDIHTENAILIFGDPARRQDIKPINHGANYGLGANRMIASGHDPAVVHGFFEMQRREFPRLMEWREEIREIGRSGQYLDNGFGRKMRCDPSRAYTQAPALMGQGSAADILKEAMLRLEKRDSRIRDMLKLTIHDEMLLSIPVTDVEEVAHEVGAAMTFEWRDVPIVCDVSKPGENWGEVSAK